MKYDMMASLCKMLISTHVYEYVERIRPAMDSRRYRQAAGREYRAIIERTESIGGIHNQFQPTMMMCAFAIAAYRTAEPLLTPEEFSGMIDAVCNCGMM